MFWGTKIVVASIMLSYLNLNFPSTLSTPPLTIQNVYCYLSDILHDQLRVLTHVQKNSMLPQQERTILTTFIATSSAAPSLPKSFHTVAALSDQHLSFRALIEFDAMLKQTCNAFLKQRNNSFLSTLNIMKLR